MARNEQLIRHHKILQLLEALRYGATLDELADRIKDELGLSSLHQRTVRRDIEALQVAGYDIQPSDSPRGRVWKVGDTFRNGFKVNASATELIALSVAREMLMPLNGTPFWQGIESFWSKLMEEVPASISDHYEKHRDTLFVLGTIPKDYADKLGVLKTLQRGIHEHRVIEILYQAPGKEPATRMLEPYATIVYVSSIYVVAADAALEGAGSRIRHWKLDRVEKATALDKWFSLPEDLDLGLGESTPGSLFSSGPTVSYTIELSDSAAQRLREDPWHPAQQLKKESSGRWLLSVDAAHPLDILPRVLSLGREAQLLEPISARDQMRKVIEELNDKYKSGDAG
jgi:predicted DNA-binding transcriptional regulator YafY